MVVSDKTKLLSTSSEVRRRVAQKLQVGAFSFEQANVSVDLGCDTGIGKVRSQRKAKARLVNATKRFRRMRNVRRSAKLSKIAGSLWTTGALP